MADDRAMGAGALLKRTFLRVCADCKQVHDGGGAWRRSVLAFVQSADVLLSHGFCPDCAAKFARELEASPAWRERGAA
jgi:hypothetical protein